MQMVEPQPEQQIRDRELAELLDELRVVLPGVTVLFAFLLTVPFSARFETISMHARSSYFIAFASSAASTILLIAPSAYHRLVGHPYDKGLMIRTSSRLAIAGTVMLGVALTAVVQLVTTVIYGDTVALVVTTCCAVLAILAWFSIPLYRRARARRRDRAPAARTHAP